MEVPSLEESQYLSFGNEIGIKVPFGFTLSKSSKTVRKNPRVADPPRAGWGDVYDLHILRVMSLLVRVLG